VYLETFGMWSLTSAGGGVPPCEEAADHPPEIRSPLWYPRRCRAAPREFGPPRVKPGNGAPRTCITVSRDGS